MAVRCWANAVPNLESPISNTGKTPTEVLSGGAASAHSGTQSRSIRKQQQLRKEIAYLDIELNTSHHWSGRPATQANRERADTGSMRQFKRSLSRGRSSLRNGRGPAEVYPSAAPTPSWYAASRGAVRTKKCSPRLRHPAGSHCRPPAWA